MPARIDEILAIADEYDIPVLEDAAEAAGFGIPLTEMRHVPGEFACLSFNGNKVITTSGGGALVCRTAEELREQSFLLRSSG